MKNILLLVTGMSPAIVTETVYGLAVNPMEGRDKWIPDEIHVISTEHGLVQVKDRLLKEGNFNKLLQDYNLPSIRFDESLLYPIVDEQGQPQYDLRTPQDNERAANLICEKVRQFTSDSNIELHVSIAGGRKTMGFYIGYALSLYGRSNDHMSHVLVEAKFDETKVPNFYYPTPEDVFVKDYAGNSWNAKDAKIWLSYIPFVRLRSSIPENRLLKEASFSEIVNSINLAQQPIKITLDISMQTITVNTITAKLPSREFAFYWWFAHQKKHNLKNIIAPHKDITLDRKTADEYPEALSLAKEYLSFYQPLKGDLGSDSVAHTLFYGMDRSFFNDRKTATLRQLKNAFGIDIANQIQIDTLVNIYTKTNNDRPKKQEREKMLGQYGLYLESEQIEIK